MAQIYTVKCPKCGKVFEVHKGILPCASDQPVPDELKMETPAVCPVCKLEILNMYSNKDR